jgi:hypothetical protein
LCLITSYRINTRKHYPKDAEIIDKLVKVYFARCYFQKVLQLADEKMNHTNIATNSNLSSIIDNSKLCAEFLKNSDLSEEKASQLCELAFSLVKDKELYVVNCNVRIVTNCIHYVIYVDKPTKEIFDLNWALAELFAELENSYADILLFEYSSVDVLKEKYA